MKEPKPFDLPPDILHLALQLGVRKTYQRGDIFLDNPVSASLFFVEKGAVRNFLRIQDLELTYWINIEGEFSCTMNFFSGTSVNTFLEALEPLEVIEIRRDLLHLAYQNNPRMEHFGRLLVEYQMKVLECNYLIISEKPAWKRYQMFLECYPQLNGRVSLKYVASLLQLDQATLSRARAKLQSVPALNMTF